MLGQWTGLRVGWTGILRNLIIFSDLQLTVLFHAPLKIVFSEMQISSLIASWGEAEQG